MHNFQPICLNATKQSPCTDQLQDQEQILIKYLQHGNRLVNLGLNQIFRGFVLKCSTIYWMDDESFKGAFYSFSMIFEKICIISMERRRILYWI